MHLTRVAGKCPRRHNWRGVPGRAGVSYFTLPAPTPSTAHEFYIVIMSPSGCPVPSPWDSTESDPSPLYRVYYMDEERFPQLVAKLKEIALTSWIAPWDSLHDDTMLLMLRLRRRAKLAGQWACKFAILAASNFIYEFQVLESTVMYLPGYNTVRKEFNETPTDSWDDL